MPEEDKICCTYPLSDFYTYVEDVPDNVRVSNAADCENCDEDCIVKHCIITENEGDKTEKEKKCDNCCPYCSSKNVDWGDSYSVTDGWYHQRATCLNCNSCFIEVSELVYKSTLLNEE